MKIYTKKIQEVLNKQIKDDNEVKGNLTYAMVCDNLFLRFDDGRWAYYTGFSWPEGGGRIELMEGLPEIYELKDACLISHQEYEEQEMLMEEYCQKQHKAEELTTLKRLQEKYGTKDN